MEFEKTLKKVVKVLQKLKIPYLVTGGVAVVVWGRPRFTADIDIVIALKREKVNQFVQTLIKEGYIDEDVVNEALKYESEFNFIDQDTGIKVDFWILKNNKFDKSRLKRRIARKILNQQVYFISPEDLILMKLLWFQQSQSTRQLEDVQSIITFSKDKLDVSYLRRWAEKLKILRLLDEVLML